MLNFLQKMAYSFLISILGTSLCKASQISDIGENPFPEEWRILKQQERKLWHGTINKIDKYQEDKNGKIKLCFELKNVDLTKTSFVTQGSALIMDWSKTKNEKTNIVTTYINTCVAAVIHDYKTSKTLLAHMAMNDDPESLRGFIKKMDISDPLKVAVTLVSRKDDAEYEELNKSFKKNTCYESHPDFIQKIGRVISKELDPSLEQKIAFSFAYLDFPMNIPLYAGEAIISISVDPEGHIFHPNLYLSGMHTMMRGKEVSPYGEMELDHLKSFQLLQALGKLNDYVYREIFPDNYFLGLNKEKPLNILKDMNEIEPLWKKKWGFALSTAFFG